MNDIDSSGRSYEVASLRRGLRILDCFLASPHRPLNASEVARAVGIHRATVFRFLNTLEAGGYLESTGSPGGYRLAARLKVPTDGATLSANMQLVTVPILKELTEETSETAALAVLHEGEMMLVHVVEGPQSVRVRQLVGTRRPAHLQALGKILLAGLNDEALEEWFAGRVLEPRTPNSITNPHQLRAQLAEIRQCGYAVDDQEYELGLSCVGAPVHDALGTTIAAVAVAGPSSRVTYHRIAELAAATQRAGDKVSRALYSPSFVLGS